MISCITLVRKKPEMSMDEFKENWVKLADKYVQLPTIQGYEQNYVFKKDKGDASFFATARAQDRGLKAVAKGIQCPLSSPFPA